MHPQGRQLHPAFATASTIAITASTHVANSITTTEAASIAASAVAAATHLVRL